MDKFFQSMLVAEIGCNHMGNMLTAKELIRSAVLECHVKYVKFQKRHNPSVFPPDKYNAPHPNPKHSYGNTYGEHREFLEFDLEQHKELKAYAEELGAVYTTSVFDLISAQEITSLNPQFIKIPSPQNNNTSVLEYLLREYSGDIHISLGMTTKQEEKNLVELFLEHRREKSLVLYACTSGYPVPYDQVALLEISRLKKEYGQVIQRIGFSGHHIGRAVDIAAYTLGAEVIERHFTLDKNWKGTDHGASLEPRELKQLKEDLDHTYSALSYKDNDIMPIEEIQRNHHKYKK